jgi:hypothetical protein
MSLRREIDSAAERAERLFSKIAPSGRQYNIVRVNDRTGERTNMLSSPVTHGEAVTIKKKLMMNGRAGRRYPHLRDVLVEVPA